MRRGAFYRAATILLVALSSITFIGFSPQPAAAAPTITSVQPNCAGHGEQAVLHGEGLDTNVTVFVGGAKARVDARTPTTVTFTVPEGAPDGATEVVARLGARGLGQEIGSLPFTVADICGGVLLEGPPESSASDALIDLPEPVVPPEDVEDGFILTRLNAAITADATVGDVNAALQSIGGSIVGMQPGDPLLEVSVPRQADEAAMRALADALKASPGIVFAWTAREMDASIVPPGGAGGSIDHLDIARFPAAWNAKERALDHCAQRVPIVVADKFGSPTPAGFFDQIPHFSSVGGEPSTEQPEHGFNVTTTLAALFDGEIPTGANPFSDCLDIQAIRLGNLDLTSAIRIIEQNLPTPGQNAIFNFSIAYRADCGSPCSPDPDVEIPSYRFADAAYLRSRLLGQENRILVTQAAANFANKPIAAIYPGVAVADYASPFSIIATGLDPTLAAEPSLWNPDPNGCPAPCPFPSLAATQTDVAEIQQFITENNLAGLPFAGNVTIVGSLQPDGIGISDFSNRGEDLFAVGQLIPTLDGLTAGTSFAAPQVAGLASYMWLLSPELRGRPVRDTLSAIRSNVFPLSTGAVPGTIDAYQTVLSLDQGVAVTPGSAPVRLRILDVANDDRIFDIDDARMYADVFNGVSSPEDPSRFDLNGDGTVGGAGTDIFDLDPTGSTQFGAPRIEPVTQSIGLFRNNYNEAALTDADILCYYAWSDLFTQTGSPPSDAPDPRVDALKGLCKWEGAEYRGTITWDHDQQPFDFDTFLATWHVEAEVTLSIQPNLTLLPTGTITYTGHFESSADGEPPADCIENDSATGQPTDYSGTFVSDFGSLSGSVSGTRTRFGSCTGGTFPITIDFVGEADAEHMFTDGILTTIDFNREITDVDGDAFVHDLFTGQLTLQTLQE